MHKRKVLLMTANFKFKCMISCLLTLRHRQRRIIFHIQKLVANYNKMPTSRTVTKYWLGVSYISSKEY